jgi:hypothetical protein
MKLRVLKNEGKGLFDPINITKQKHRNAVFTCFTGWSFLLCFSKSFVELIILISLKGELCSLVRYLLLCAGPYLTRCQTPKLLFKVF